MLLLLNTWLAVSLSQTPTSTLEQQLEALSAMEQRLEALEVQEQQAKEQAEARAQVLEQRTGEMESQLELLSQSEQATQEARARTEERAEALEAARQDRLAALELAMNSLVEVDRLLEVGDRGIATPFNAADQALARVEASAEQDGQGRSAILVEQARGLIAVALDASERRDFYQARFALQSAGSNIEAAHLQTVNQSASTLVLRNR